MPRSIALPRRPRPLPSRPFAPPPRRIHWPLIAATATLAGAFVVGATLVVRPPSHRPAPVPTRLPETATIEPPAGTVTTDALKQPSADRGETPNLVVLGNGLPALMNPATALLPPEPEAVQEAIPPIKRPAPRPFLHQQRLAADDLCRQLRTVPEFDLETVPGSANKLVALARSQKERSPHTLPDLLAQRTDLRGLPMRMGLECQLGKESAEYLQVLSRKLRIYLAESVPRDGIDTRPDPVVLRRKLLAGKDAERGDWLQPEAVPTLVQLLQAEDKPLRLLLVELLGRIKSRTATQALTQRAIFDLCEEVREAAVTALRDRPAADCRPALLEGLRYPWAPVADHAAEALIALGDRAALAGLVHLLDEPDPALPMVPCKDKPRLMVRELVRVNHLRNCLLCHAASVMPAEPVRGLVPTPGQPVPPTFSPQYYEAATGTFVRADITYLKQDFSVPQPVARPDAWPGSQRYDYCLRTRPATLDELATLADPPATYPQRESVLFALRELTGRNAGPSARDWQQVLATATGNVTMER